MLGPPSQAVLYAALLWAITRGPPEVRTKLLEYVPSDYLPYAIWGLRGLIGVSVLRSVNRLLNRMALNHWHINAPSAAKWKWNDEVAVVTGGSSGFGLILTRNLAAMGVKVAMVDRNEMPAEFKMNENVTFFKYDLTDIAGISGLADDIRSKLGRPSILINNAGIGEPKTLLEMSDKFVDTIFKVNLLSHFKLIKEFVPDMVKANKGHVIEIASAASFVTVGKITDYCATKAGVMALWEGLNQELRHLYNAPGVVTTIVHPSWAATPLVQRHQTSKDRAAAMVIMAPEKVTDPILDHIKKGKGGQIIVPGYVTPAASLRSWPFWLQEALRGSQSILLRPQRAPSWVTD